MEPEADHLKAWNIYRSPEPGLRKRLFRLLLATPTHFCRGQVASKSRVDHFMRVNEDGQVRIVTIYLRHIKSQHVCPHNHEISSQKKSIIGNNMLTFLGNRSEKTESDNPKGAAMIRETSTFPALCSI